MPNPVSDLDHLQVFPECQELVGEQLKIVQWFASDYPEHHVIRSVPPWEGKRRGYSTYDSSMRAGVCLIELIPALAQTAYTLGAIVS